MNCSPSVCKDTLGHLIADAGAVAWGVSEAAPLPAEAVERYRRWIAAGCHADMAWLTRYDDVRSDPRLLLPGARSVISCAFPYSRPVAGTPLRIASYALGDDYHDVLRERLAPAVRYLEECGERARVCVDTAPLRERLHAVQAGVGFIGRSGMLIVPGTGSYVFLAEIVTTAAIAPDAPCTLSCDGCDRCITSCPGGAIGPEGTVDARRCLSYLTIEYRGEQFPEGTRLQGRFYGCDTCQQVCPHNAGTPTAPLAEFEPRPELLTLTAADVAALTPESYRRLTRHSAMRRAKLPMLLRNLPVANP